MNLNELRKAHNDAISRALEAATAIEAAGADADFDTLETDLTSAQSEVERSKKNIEIVERSNEARKNLVPLATDEGEKRHARPAGSSTEPETYSEREAKVNKRSFVHDLVGQLRGDSSAGERLQRHMKEMQEKRDITRVDGAGGEFVPPVWLVDRYFDLARPARTVADLATKLDLPSGTDSINIPRITTGAAVAVQASDNASIQETDMVTATVTAPVRTIAGQQDVAIQLLDQSAIPFDEVIFKSLAADYNQKLDLQVIAGAGTAGTLRGYGSVTGINAVTYVDATPTVPELYSKLADAYNRVLSNRFLPPDAWVMHPRRWMWMLAAADANSRPLVVPVANGPFNAVGVHTGNVAQGVVGYLLGLPVYLDPSVNTLAGAGTEDIIYIARFQDAYLFEGTPRTRVLMDVLSQTLTARFQLYNYVAFTAEGFPSGISTVQGSGLIAPTF